MYFIDGVIEDLLFDLSYILSVYFREPVFIQHACIVNCSQPGTMSLHMFARDISN